MNEWLPVLTEQRGPLYLAIVGALEADISAGILPAGARLLPLREMAGQLGISVGTVAKAYAQAEKHGLVRSEVGRGTFVLGEKRRQRESFRPDGRIRNLALNIPPPTGESELLGAVLGEIAASPAFSKLLDYQPHQGTSEHRQMISAWLHGLGMEVPITRLVITPGAQHGIDLAMRLLTQRGDHVLTENATYSGIMSLSALSGLKLTGVETDEEGLIPEALDQAFSEFGARVLYATPTIQTPTGAIMSESRRDEIARIVAAHDAFIVEDDAYMFLPATPLSAISSRIPERSFHVTSFAKCLAPGLRVGALIVPTDFRNGAIQAMRVSGWMAVPVMVECVCRLIQDGRLALQVERKRRQADLRDSLARRVLGGLVPPRKGDPGFHLWLPIPEGRSPATVIAQANQAGLTLSPPDTPSPEKSPQGIRLCLGAIAELGDLEASLLRLRSILEGEETMSFL